MIVYISGGCKNGKSSFAEQIAYNLKEKENPLYYIATMNPCDKEDNERIKKHIKQRERFNFKTIEINRNIDNLENICDLKGSFLIDSATALLVNEMFLENGDIIENAYLKVAQNLNYILNKMKNVVIVSDYIFSDTIKYDNFTEMYRKGLAFIDKSCAKYADVVIEVSYGNLKFFKGENLKEKLCQII